MKIKTSELTDAALDWAVNQIEECCDDPTTPRFSTDWAQGGPIIEREWISIECWPNESDESIRWVATRYEQPAISETYGPTPLIAAMRCYVASHLGDEVDVPEELK